MNVSSVYDAFYTQRRDKPSEFISPFIVIITYLILSKDLGVLRYSKCIWRVTEMPVVFSYASLKKTNTLGTKCLQQKTLWAKNCLLGVYSGYVFLQFYLQHAQLLWAKLMLVPVSVFLLQATCLHGERNRQNKSENKVQVIKLSPRKVGCVFTPFFLFIYFLQLLLFQVLIFSYFWGLWFVQCTLLTLQDVNDTKTHAVH